METALIVAALGLLVIAGAVSIAARQYARENRERAAARIEALRVRALSDTRPAAVRPFVRPAEPVRTVSAGMFGAAVEPPAPRRRWIALAAVSSVMAAVIAIVYVLHDPAVRPPAGREAAARDVVASPASAVVRTPVALLSLRHVADGAGLFTVAGMVQNPATGRDLSGVVAVVDVFDRNGRLLASGKAALDVPALRAGDASAFVVKIPDAGDIRRYQVTFRLDDGTVIAHVDRRGPRTDEARSVRGTN